jgi:lysozyme
MKYLTRKFVLKIVFWAVPFLIGGLLLVGIVAAVISAVTLGGKTDASGTTSTGPTASQPGNVTGLPVSNNLMAFLESWEGFSATEATGEDYWNLTIGYGHVVQPGEIFTSLTQDAAQQLLISDLSNGGYIKSVQNEFGKVLTTQSQLDALVSLCYNIGTGGWGDLNLTQDIKDGSNADTLKADFESICYVGGQYSPGLERRRDAEWLMFTQGVYQLNT